MIAEMIMRYKRWNQEGFLQTELSEYGAGAVDLYCQNSAAGALAASSSGCDWVDFDVANFTRGNIPVIKKAAVSTRAIGCVHFQEGAIAASKFCWVRVFGWHPYAKVLGAASLIAGYPLVMDSANAGVAGYSASPYDEVILGSIVAAYATASVAAKAVFIENPRHLPL
ncbi:MAG: hypothetical protein E6Q97_13500 [Desulfurellales bacterium]|nr:MAG: hypothetical protein E6Q97_13500 [Desulfurellales bacterium]